MAMTCESIRLHYSDHYEAHGRLWQVPSPRGAILYLHGIQSHGAWFEASAQRLAQAGFTVLLPDRRGSGRNTVDRGDTPSADRLLGDLVECLDELHVRTGLSRFHLVGVSWGGKLALSLFRLVPTRIHSLTLIAPGLFPKVDLSLAQKLRVGWSAITARRTLFDIPLNRPELFTANPARREYIRKDLLALRRVTARFLLASRQLDRQARIMLRTKAHCPLMLFLAGHERIIDNQKTRTFIEQLGWPQRQTTEYPHAHHTLEFEPDPEPFFNDLITWLDSF